MLTCLRILSVMIVALTSVSQVSAHELFGVGVYQACALTADEGLKCWSHPVFPDLYQIPPDVQPATSLFVGDLYVCARNVSGEAKCWGGVTIATSFSIPGVNIQIWKIL